MSQAFERFKESYSKHFSREGPDLSLLDEMEEKEREEVEALLLRKLKPDDIFEIEILGYLRSQRAFAPLAEMLPQADGRPQAVIAEALWRIRRYEPALSILCQMVVPGSRASQRARVWATIGLRGIPEEPAIEALRLALDDNDDPVRYHALRSLAVVLGLKEELWTLEREMNIPAQRDAANEKLRRLVENALQNHAAEENA